MDYEIDTKTPYPSSNRASLSEYVELLEKLKPGQSIKTKDEKVAVRVSNGLRRALQVQGADAHYKISRRTNMADGYHRVFLLAKPVKMADLPGRKIVNLKG